MERILHNIGGIGLGGSQTFVMELYRKMDRSKIQFDFVIFSDKHADEGYKNEILSLGGKIFLSPRYSAKNHFKFCKWWKNFFRDHPEYRIIHGHVYSCASVYLSIAKRYGLKTICHAHSTANGGNFVSRIIKRLYEIRIKNIADYLFACSTDAGRWLYGVNATKKDNYYLIPNCIDVAKFSFSKEKRREIRDLHGVTEETFLIGHVGSFRVAKNHEFIISVFERIKLLNSNAVLMLVGVGDRMDHIKEICDRKNLSEAIIFAGNRHNVSDYYSAFDCFLFPSLWEGLPVSVVEAQASGLPCFISDRITKDVVLTDLIETISLNESANYWAERVLTSAGKQRCAADVDEIGGLSDFDSDIVSKKMQDFYLSINKG